MKSDVVIIGAGLAGLTCARALAQRDVESVVLEATDRVGGRVRTDVVDGFQLDHGFQVLLTAYPACRTWLDYDALRLRPFSPGARVRVRDDFALLADPWRSPAKAIQSALSRVGSLTDKLKVGLLRSRSQAGTLEELYERTNIPTRDHLEASGFSPGFIERFFQPFLGGVFLEEDLKTSSRLLEFVFRMFASGPIAIPADGMAAIPRQLAEGLPRGTIRLQSTVASLDGPTVNLTDGTSVEGRQIVIAAEAPAAGRLLSSSTPQLGSDLAEIPWNATICHYFTSRSDPGFGKYLTLCGDDRSGPVNHVAQLSTVAPEYAPPGQTLVSVSVRTGHLSGDLTTSGLDSVDEAQAQLQRWCGDDSAAWEHLRTYAIPFALPAQLPERCEKILRSVEPAGDSGPVLCGDHRETSSIQGAMHSGERAAEAILKRLGCSD